MKTDLYCASCGRANDDGENGVIPITYNNIHWCTVCAEVRETPGGSFYVCLPSPGRMYANNQDDPLNAWEDCYSITPKKRISIEQAKTEVIRAWSRWDGAKHGELSKFQFFGWMSKHRPYFLTFNGNDGSGWQIVSRWLSEDERLKTG